MSQVYPDSPGVIYRLLDADPEFSALVGTYKFVDGQTSNAISLLTPGADIPGVESIDGMECIIHDISNLQRIDFINDSSILVNEWKVFLVAWDPATGEDVNNAARRIMQLFRGATSTQTVRTSEGLKARVQTVVTIPSNQPLDIDGMAIYGPQPVINITSDINNIEPGQEVTLTWSISSSLRAEMDNEVGPINLSDSRSFVVDKTTTFNITAYNDFTSKTTGFQVNVLDPVITSFDFVSTGTQGQYTVSWSAAYATEIRFNGRYDWPLTGSATVTVATPTEFILEAYSEQASVTESILIDPTMPTLLSAATTADGTGIVLTYDETLSETTAPISSFEVLVDEVPAVITAVEIDGSSVTLVLETAILPGQAIAFNYTAPSVDYTADNEAVQDVQGNDADSVTEVSVDNEAV